MAQTLIFKIVSDSAILSTLLVVYHRVWFSTIVWSSPAERGENPVYTMMMLKKKSLYYQDIGLSVGVNGQQVMLTSNGTWLHLWYAHGSVVPFSKFVFFMGFIIVTTACYLRFLIKITILDFVTYLITIFWTQRWIGGASGFSFLAPRKTPDVYHCSGCSLAKCPELDVKAFLMIS